jgi:biopolymer transport protein ExbB
VLEALGVSANLLLAAVGGAAEHVTNAAPSTVEAVEEIAAEAAEVFVAADASLADWVAQGGIMMIPLFFCAIAALAIIIERTFSLRRIRIDAREFTERISRVVRARKIAEAEVICENTPGPMAAIIKSALFARDKSGEEIRIIVEETAERESSYLERYLPALGTIGTVSPLIGLLGTVLGMIKSSNFLATFGADTGQISGLIGGISEALITTAAGLFVAIPAVVSHSFFTNKVNVLILDMEAWTNDILALLGRARQGSKQRAGRKVKQGKSFHSKTEPRSARFAPEAERGAEPPLPQGEE